MPVTELYAFNLICENLLAALYGVALINSYAGTGDHYEFRGNNKYPDEFITLPFEAGRTYNKKTGKYEATNRVQIKYDENKGAHIFPVLMR